MVESPFISSLLFFFSSEKRTVLFLSLFAGGFFSPAVARIACRFHVKFELRRHVVVQLDRHFVFAGILNRAFEHDFMAVDFLPDLIL